MKHGLQFLTALAALTLAPGSLIHAAPSWTVREVGSGPGATYDNLYAVAHAGGTNVVAVGAYGKARFSTDNGETWVSQSPGSLAFYGVTWTGTRVVAVGDNGNCTWTENQGANWQTAQPANNYEVLNAVCHRSGILVAVGRYGTVKVSINNGDSWTVQSSGTTQHLQGIATDATTFVAVGENGAVLRSTNGTSWTLTTVSSPSNNNDFRAVAWTGTRFVAVGGNTSEMGAWTSPDGSAWTFAASIDGRHCVVWNGSNVIAGGVNVWESPGGLSGTWASSSRPLDGQIRGIAVLPGGGIVAVADYGGIATAGGGSGGNPTLAVTADPPAGGTVGGGGSYAAGTQVTATATPSGGYRFVEWTENGSQVSTNASYTFNLTTTRSLVGRFEALPSHTIATGVSPAGAGTTTGDGTYPQGAGIAVTATPNTGWQFVHWTEGSAVVAVSGSYSFPVTASRTLVAHFAQVSPNRTITVNPSANGSVTGGGSHPDGSMVVLTAVPHSGCRFLHWLENGRIVSTDRVWRFKARANRTIDAVFVPAGQRAMVRRFVHHQITSLTFSPASEGHYAPVLSGDGSRAVFSVADDVYMVGADGGDPVLVNENFAWNPLLDIRNDGGTAIYSDGGRLRVATPITGSGATAVQLDGAIWAIRIAGDSGQVFFQVRTNTSITGGGGPVNRGIWTVNPNGTNLRQIVSAQQIATLVGKDPDSDIAFFSSSARTLDVSDDGSRIVFGCSVGGLGDGLWGVNSDGSGLYQIVGPSGIDVLNHGVISGDGSRVVYNFTPAPGSQGLHETHAADFGTGLNRVKLIDHTAPGYTLPNGYPTWGNDPFSINRDGTLLLFGSSGNLIDTWTGSRVQLAIRGDWWTSDPPPVLYDGMWRASMNATADRFLYLAGDGTGVNQLIIMDLDPVSSGAAPAISDAWNDPGGVLTQSRTGNQTRAVVTSPHIIERVSSGFLRNRLQSNDILLGSVMLDDGAFGGDTTAGDGRYSGSPTWYSGNLTGELQCRVKAQVRVAADNRRHATSVEFTPFQVSSNNVTIWANAAGLTGPAAGPAADPDGDTLPNIVEYAFNLAPDDPGLRRLVSGTGTTGLPNWQRLPQPGGPALTVEFLRRKSDPALRYMVAFADDPTNWSPATQAEAVTAVDNDWERVVVTDDPAKAGAPRRFGRVVVTRD